MKSTILCECGHPAAEHTPRPGGGVLSFCQHDRGSTVRAGCKCRAFGVARICAGCGGDGIGYDVSDRRRQIARQPVHLSKPSGHGGSRGVTDCPGVEPVANPFIEAIRRLEHLRSIGYELAHDVHTLIAASPRGDGRDVRLPPRVTPASLPELVHAAWGVWPDEMCQFCYGNGRARSRRFPVLDRQVSAMEADLTTTGLRSSPVDSPGAAKC